ncbi:guanine nucleotide binding protein 3 [Tieghemostelium lacteum]|uniref:Guanine nucleotide binding protein 3 n=1 Tax=Tieghemostelium lacteum TaxID=361077 RepID=A0A151ZEC2_TIELA|nr:guanine nucleotide binding protein 3 [Tieghemostelium lacteum]|eukprot:KYQ92306.1 guanine nucleotide binding protein 3 [Tieghemostelium lacteum]
MAKHRASKRQSLHQKHKIEKKVADHNRKVRKATKDNPSLIKSKKDPGIPNLWPFKEQMLTQIENKRAQIAEDKKKKKEKKKREMKLENLASDAQKRESEFQKKQELKQQRESQNQYQKEAKDTSLKAFYREVKKVIEASDVILQVLDARDPMGCRCMEIEQMILERYPNKKIVLILNKIDLIPRENVAVWLKYLRNFYPTLAFKCSTQQQKRNLGQSSVAPELASKELLNSTESLGAESLLQLLKNYSRSLNIKVAVTVGIVGYPNVGKSSLINSLKRTRSVGVGATPGFTKVAQEVHLDKNVKLLDSPGIVPVRGAVDDNIILRNVVKIQKISDPIAPVETILARCSKEQLLSIYEIQEFENPTQFLTLLAHKRKKFSKGGSVDLKRTALTVIEDWNGGKIPFYTLPPKDTSLLKTTFVSEFSNEFNIDQSEFIAKVSSKDNSSFASYESKQKSIENIDNSIFDEDEDMMDDNEDEEEDDQMVEDDEEEEDEEEDDDDQMDQDSDEEDEEDQMIEQNIQKKFQTLPVKKLVQKEEQKKVKVQNLKDDNDQFNPQSNKDKKKQLKKLKKKNGTISNTFEQQAKLNNKQQYSNSNSNSDDDDDDDDDEDIDEENVILKKNKRKKIYFKVNTTIFC